MNLGSIYTCLGKLDLALISTLKSLKIDPGDAFTRELGNIYFQQGAVSDAEEAYDRAIKLTNQNRDSCLKEKQPVFSSEKNMIRVLRY